MSERRKYRAGDVVRHIDFGDDWLLACDEWAGRVANDGWAPSWYPVAEVELVKAASDDERLAMLLTTAKRGCRVRSAQAQAALDAEPKPRRTLADVVANPPEGWTAQVVADGAFIMEWRLPSPSFSFWHARIEVDDDGNATNACVQRCLSDGASKSAAHRAVADLLDLLAEVEP